MAVISLLYEFSELLSVVINRNYRDMLCHVIEIRPFLSTKKQSRVFTEIFER